MIRTLTATLAALCSLTGVVFAVCAFGPTWVAYWWLVSAALWMIWGLLVSIEADRWRRISAAERKSRCIPVDALYITVDALYAEREREWARRGFTTTVVHQPPVAHTVIEGGKRPVWPGEIGAPE